MSLFDGSLSYRRFKTIAPMPTDLSPDSVRDLLRRYSFQPIPETDPSADRSVGWCGLGRPSDITFSPDSEDGTMETRDLFWGDKIQFCLRIDTKKMPAIALLEEVRRLEKGYREQNGIEPGDLIGRRERKNIKELATINLSKRVIPTTGLFDVQIQTRWDGDRIECGDGESCLWLVRFFSLSRPVVDEFMELFEEAFSIGLLPMGVYGLATSIFRDENAILNLSDIRPSIFAPVGSASGSSR